VLLRGAVCGVNKLQEQREIARVQPDPQAVILAQALARRWLAKRELRELRRLAAVKVQKEAGNDARAQLASKTQAARREAEAGFLDLYRKRARNFGKTVSYVLPHEWAVMTSVGDLTRIMTEFIGEHSADIVREERFKRELFNSIASRFDQQTKELQEIRQQMMELAKIARAGESVERGTARVGESVERRTTDLVPALANDEDSVATASKRSRGRRKRPSIERASSESGVVVAHVDSDVKESSESGWA